MRTRSVSCWLNRSDGGTEVRAVRLLLALFLIIGQPLGAVVEAAHSYSEGMSAVAASPNSATDSDLDAGHGALSHANACHHRGACTVLAILPRSDLTLSVRTSEDAVFAERAVQGHSKEPNTPPPIA